MLQVAIGAGSLLFLRRGQLRVYIRNEGPGLARLGNDSNIVLFLKPGLTRPALLLNCRRPGQGASIALQRSIFVECFETGYLQH